MGREQPQDRPGEVEQATAGQFTGAAGPGEAPAWEEVSTGRYMPRRIKGSCKGRALGWTFVIPSGSDGQIIR